MSGRSTGAARLPASHVFFTVAWEHRHRTVAVPRWAAMLAMVVLALGLLWSLGCSVYVAGHDGLLAASVRRERDLQYGYEDRIASLQRQLDRSLSEGARLARTVGTRLDTLTAKEGELRRKAQVFAHLAETADRSGPPAAVARRVTGPASPAAGMASAADASPSAAQPAQDATGLNQQATERLAALTLSLNDLETGQEGALLRLQKSASAEIARLRGALGEAGLGMPRFAPAAIEAVGGPFVPLDANSVASPFDRSVLLARAALDEAGSLRAAAAHVPFGRPLAGTPEVTSPFGARTDPFLGRPALHTGIDLRDDAGSTVLATAAGRVVAAGPASGYGLMVEVDHGAGLSTRYAHLSAIDVAPGQAIGKGEAVGQVGATGRATGPHLHYETRIDGEPVDPARFLLAGRLLATDAAGP